MYLHYIIVISGEWLLFAVYFVKYLQSGGSESAMEESEELVGSLQDWFSLRFKGYVSVLIPSTIVSYVLYFGLGGFLHVRMPPKWPTSFW